jgi:hypothetical protein
MRTWNTFCLSSGSGSVIFWASWIRFRMIICTDPDPDPAPSVSRTPRTTTYSHPDACERGTLFTSLTDPDL